MRIGAVMRVAVLVAAVAAGVGCDRGGGRGGKGVVRQRSDTLATLAERVAFLEKHVTFRRGYEALAFDVMAADNSGGGVPGPSEWDIRFIAVVPEGEVEKWVPGGVKAKGPRETEVTDAKARVDKLAADLDMLATASPDDWWDVTKHRVEDYLDRVEASVKRLDDNRPKAE